MSDVITLLDLPITSKGFTTLRASATEALFDGSASPPRKIARLDGDSDAHSVSRSRPNATDRNGGIIALQLVGEPMRPAPENPQEYAQVRRCIRTLLTKGTDEKLPITHEAIYLACRSIVCVANKGEGLYNGLKIEVDQCLSRLAKDLRDETRTEVEWVAEFVEACKWFSRQAGILKSWLTYLDRVYVLRDVKLANVYDLCVAEFSQRMYLDPQITERLRSGIHAWALHERNNQPHDIQRATIRELIQHLHAHEQYVAVFETYYLSVTKAFYAAESLQKYERNTERASDVLAFIDHCGKRCAEEDEMCRAVLLERSRPLAKQAVERSLVEGRLKWLAEKVVGVLMVQKDIPKMIQLYGLFTRNGGVKILCHYFKLYILTKVTEIVQDTTADENMVQNLLDFKLFIDSTLPTAFADEIPVPAVGTSQAGAAPPRKQPNQEFVYAVSDAFQHGFRARRNKPAEMIAKYLDKAMRHGQKGVSDAEFEGMLDSVLALYRFTNDKDVFRTFYHRALAKRLLLERSASDDFEKAMLKKLKEQYDPEFGMGDHMFKDLALSRDTMKEFRAKKYADHPPEALNVMVLQQSVWPFAARKTDVDLPSHMQSLLTDYTAFYQQRHKGHKLEWDHALGTATLNAKFKDGSKELSVSLYQAVVLLLFNDATELSYVDISEVLRMDAKELRRTLQSLACGMKKVLKKRPDGKDVGDDDTFYFNADFTDPRKRVHINSIQSKETPEESKKAHETIEGDRKHYLDAAIVRIMKARKEMAYEQLKAATIDAVKGHFVPEVSVIKQRIAALVEQDYLARDDEDMNLYTYVA